MPERLNTIAAAISMARKLARKRRNAPRARSNLFIERHSPQTVRGGTSAVAMATPGRAGLTFLFTIA